MNTLTQVAPFFVFPVLAMVIGVNRSWQGLLDRERYLAWELGLTLGIPVVQHVGRVSRALERWRRTADLLAQRTLQ